MTVGTRITITTSVAAVQIWNAGDDTPWFVHGGPNGTKREKLHEVWTRDDAEYYGAWIYLAGISPTEHPQVTWDGPYDASKSREENDALYPPIVPQLAFPEMLFLELSPEIERLRKPVLSREQVIARDIRLSSKAAPGGLF